MHFSFRFIEPSKDIFYNMPKKNWPNFDKNIIRRQRASRNSTRTAENIAKIGKKIER